MASSRRARLRRRAAAAPSASRNERRGARELEQSRRVMRPSARPRVRIAARRIDVAQLAHVARPVGRGERRQRRGVELARPDLARDLAQEVRAPGAGCRRAARAAAAAAAQIPPAGSRGRRGSCARRTSPSRSRSVIATIAHARPRPRPMPPTRRSRPDSSTRRSLGCRSSGSSPISSSTSVPPDASSNQPAPPRRRAGEGAALVAEELALGQLARQRAAVDRHERAAGVRARARAARARPAPCRCRSRRVTSTGVAVGATSARARQRRAQRRVLADDRRQRRSTSLPAPACASSPAVSSIRMAVVGGAPTPVARRERLGGTLRRPRPTQAFAALADLLLPDRRARLRRSIAARQASNAGARWAAAAAMATAVSPTASAPDAVVDGDAHAGPLALDLRRRSRPAPPRPSRGRPRTRAGPRRAGGARAAGRSRRRSPPRRASPPATAATAASIVTGSARDRGWPARRRAARHRRQQRQLVPVGAAPASSGATARLTAICTCGKQRRHRRVARRDRRARVADRGAPRQLDRLLVEPRFARAARRNREPHLHRAVDYAGAGAASNARKRRFRAGRYQLFTGKVK